MATAAKLVTVAELLARPEIAAGMAGPGHASLRHRVQSVPRRAIGDMAIVRVGMPFRARPEHELRRADVGVVSVARPEAVQKEDFPPVRRSLINDS